MLLQLIIFAGVAFSEPSSDYTPSAQELTLHQALSARHNVPSCEQLEEGIDHPATAWLNLSEHAATPPWVPLRAATCLIKRHAENPAVKNAFLRWVSEERWMGLGKQLLNQLDQLPESHAIEVATQALANGPASLDAKGRVLNDSRPGVRALATRPPPL
ncbi:MAG: hypothetical protein GWP91_12980 [Rhodobacterales bacterium]|nr:hypothetical protein [Rhodobacterales bacterium]